MSLLHKRREMRLRRRAARWDYRLTRSRRKHLTPHDLGEYMLIDLEENASFLGHAFDATLDDVEVYLTELEKSVVPAAPVPSVSNVVPFRAREAATCEEEV